MEDDLAASTFEFGEQRARLRRPSRRTARRLATLALLSGLAACALLVWPGFLRGGTAYVIVSGNSMEPTLHAGDLVLTVPHRTYNVGDVVAYRIPEGQPGAGVLIIHRIVGGSASSRYIVQGDNRAGRDPWRPRPRDIVGGEALRVPRLGLALVYVRTPLGLATVAGILTALLILGGLGTDGSSEGTGAKRRAARRPHRHGGTEEPDAAPLGSEEPLVGDSSTDDSSEGADTERVAARPGRYGRTQGLDPAPLGSAEPVVVDAPSAVRLATRLKDSSRSWLSHAASNRRSSAAARLRITRAAGGSNCVMKPGWKTAQNCRTPRAVLKVARAGRERQAVEANRATPTEGPATLTSRQQHGNAFPIALSQSWGEGTWTARDLLLQPVISGRDRAPRA
jgi:signal peptidase